jgi:hypothetical protein
MASTTGRKADTGFIIILASVYLTALLIVAAFVTAEILRNGIEIWSVCLLTGSLAASALWAFTAYRFLKATKRTR